MLTFKSKEFCMIKDYETAIEGTKQEIKAERDDLRYRVGALQRKVRELVKKNCLGLWVSRRIGK